MRDSEYGLSVATTNKLIMVLAWCIQSKEYRDRVLEQLPGGEPLVDAFRTALDGDAYNFKHLIHFKGPGKLMDGITSEVIQVMQARAERRDLGRRWFETWSKQYDAPQQAEG